MCICPAQWKQHISSIEFYLDLWTAEMRCRNWFDLASVRSDRTRIEGYFGSHEWARTRNWIIHSAQTYRDTYIERYPRELNEITIKLRPLLSSMPSRILTTLLAGSLHISRIRAGVYEIRYRGKESFFFYLLKAPTTLFRNRVTVI